MLFLIVSLSYLFCFKQHFPQKQITGLSDQGVTAEGHQLIAPCGLGIWHSTLARKRGIGAHLSERHRELQEEVSLCPPLLLAGGSTEL